ncbi:GNAT family N-acetyltransferase [Nocardia sp. NPDC048505]|uniref:GNAT family N-acetyltransferase n=1 Tax=unclassified Nocardia TaxID=2637762 RepID=UPI0033DC478B
MHTQPQAPDSGATITRISDSEWQAEAAGRVIGHGGAWQRPDGRVFLGIDVWQRERVFDALAQAMLAALPRPLYTLVDAADPTLTAGWQRTGFATEHREWHLLLRTDPQVSGLDSPPPADLTILPAGAAEPGPLGELDRAIRSELGSWRDMPADVWPRLAGDTVLDPENYAVAVRSGRYVGLIRSVAVRRSPRIALLAVRAEQQRQGIARALLTHTLDSLHRRGIDSATTDVKEANAAATALFDGIGARRATCTLELVLR